MAPERWRIRERDENGRTVECAVQASSSPPCPRACSRRAPPPRARSATALYGVDLKEIDGDYVVIEVNDNPNIDAATRTPRTPSCTRHRQLLAGEWGEDAAHGTLATGGRRRRSPALLTP
jgi:hypothetical protein